MHTHTFYLVVLNFIIYIILSSPRTCRHAYIHQLLSQFLPITFLLLLRCWAGEQEKERERERKMKRKKIFSIDFSSGTSPAQLVRQIYIGVYLNLRRQRLCSLFFLSFLSPCVCRPLFQKMNPQPPYYIGRQNKRFLPFFPRKSSKKKG